jgi:hypothetical protein
MPFRVPIYYCKQFLGNWYVCMCCRTGEIDEHFVVNGKVHPIAKTFHTKNRNEIMEHEQTPEHKDAFRTFVNRIAKRRHVCEACDYTTLDKSNFNKHMNSTTHHNIVNGIDTKHHHCEACNYTTDRFNNWTKHLKTEKHVRKTTS